MTTSESATAVEECSAAQLREITNAVGEYVMGVMYEDSGSYSGNMTTLISTLQGYATNDGDHNDFIDAFSQGKTCLGGRPSTAR